MVRLFLEIMPLMGTFDVVCMKCLRLLFPELVQSYYSHREILLIVGIMWAAIEPMQQCWQTGVSGRGVGGQHPS